MTERDPVGAAAAGRRRTWVARAVTTVPLLAMTAGWTLVLGDRADAPIAEMLTVAAAPALPDTTVPEAVTAPTTTAPGSLRTAPTADLARTASAADIPDAALAAYQRAATVINATDHGCRLSWELLAGIGRVESNHGRFAGSVLDEAGVAQPAILGVALDGSRGTTLIADTDQGLLDGDPVYDRAVGPMQFIPSTWTYVGVDADGDGVRDPQDIDDAALAAAVYLCVGEQDLSTDAGRRTAVHRYNHSQSYVDLVLRLARSYEEGGFTSVPTGDLPSLPATTQTRPTGPLQTPASTPQPTAEHVWQPAADQVTPDPPGGDPPDPDPATPAEPSDPNHPDPPPDGPVGPGEGVPDPGDPAPGDPAPGDPAPDGPAPDDPAGQDGTDAATDPTPITPESAVDLCLEIGYVDDPDTADEPYDLCLALLLAEPPGTDLPTPEQLFLRLEDEGIPLPPS